MKVTEEERLQLANIQLQLNLIDSQRSHLQSLLNGKVTEILANHGLSQGKWIVDLQTGLITQDILAEAAVKVKVREAKKHGVSTNKRPPSKRADKARKS